MAKLIKCKTCGADIAKSAKRCPHCGAKNIPPLSVRLGLAAFAVAVEIIIILTIFPLFRPGNDSAKNKTEISRDTVQKTVEQPGETDVLIDEPEIIEISATDLWAMYDENEVNADILYKDKTLWVTGIVREIGKNGNTPYVLLKAGDKLGVFSIQCNFNKTTEQDKLALIRDGNYIRIGGKCTGKSINVILKNCTIEW